MAYSQSQWDQVQHWFEIGIPLSEIAKKTEIKDKGSISRKAKQEGWIKGKNATVVKKEVEARQALSEVEEEKATKNATEQAVINAAVAEQLQNVQFFKKSHLLTARTVVMKVQREGVNASFSDLNQAASALVKAQESVLGKQPTIAIQNNNGVTIDNESQTVAKSSTRAERMQRVRALLESNV